MPVFVQYVPTLLFRRPFSRSFDAPHRQHDMDMRISICFVMQRPIRTHALIDKIFLHIIMDELNLLVTG
jgi:hypothetical protein